MPQPESAVVKSCLLWLQYHPELGVFHRVNNTGTWHTERKLFLKPKYITLGFPDIVGVRRNGIACFIECKSESGKQRKDQKEFQREVLKCGAEYILARSVDDLENHDWLSLKKCSA